MDELLRYMRAMVMLQLQTVQAAGEPGPVGLKPELLLSDAGFTSREIATMLGKTPAAVAKAITRGRSSRRVKTELDASTFEEEVPLNG